MILKLLQQCWQVAAGCLGWRKVEAQKLTPAGNPLPATVHQALHASDLGPGRLIIVGDIHGCLDTLLDLLRKLQYAPRHDNLILVGDLVNKGPKSQQVVAAARAWCEGSFCWVVRGNHDDAALAAGLYLQQGRGNRSDLKSKLSWVEELLPQDVEFLTELPFSLQVEGYNILVVHAALLPGVPLQSHDLAVMTKVRDLLQTPTGSYVGLEQPQEGSQAWAGFWKGPGHVFFGHDAKRNLQKAPFATGLDTGCVYGRQLTACVLPPLSDLLLNKDTTRHKQRKGRPKAGKSESAAAEPPGTTSRLLPSAPSLLDLRGELHSIPSGFMYEKPAAKEDKKKAIKQASKSALAKK